MAAKKKSSTKAKAGRQARVAASVVAGKSVTRIAKEERISRATASRTANSPEVQLLITSLAEAESAKIRVLYKAGLQAIEDSFKADRTAVFEGALVNCGADHYARLTGVKCLTQLLTAGRQAVRPEPVAKQSLTLEELKHLARADRIN